MGLVDSFSQSDCVDAWDLKSDDTSRMKPGPSARWRPSALRKLSYRSWSFAPAAGYGCYGKEGVAISQ